MMMRFAWIEEPPFNFARPGGAGGCDVELIGEVARRMGEPLELVRTDFAELLPGLRDGRWDVTTGMFVTPVRAVLAAFTRPVWALSDGLLVRAEDAGRITGYRSVARDGLRLAVLRGQVQQDRALSAGVEPGNVVMFETYAEAAAAVTGGGADAYASVVLAHRAYIASRKAGLTCIAVPVAEAPPAPGGFACASSAVRDRIDAELSGLIGTPWHRAMWAHHGLGASELPEG